MYLCIYVCVYKSYTFPETNTSSLKIGFFLPQKERLTFQVPLRKSGAGENGCLLLGPRNDPMASVEAPRKKKKKTYSFFARPNGDVMITGWLQSLIVRNDRWLLVGYRP